MNQQDQPTPQSQPMAGQVVGSAAHVTEGAVQQVESAVQTAALTASNSGLARLIGYLRAGHTIVDGALEGGLNIAQSGRQHVSGEFATDLINELEGFRQKLDQAIREATSGGAQNR